MGQVSQQFNQDGSANIGVSAKATSAAPSYTDGTQQPLSQTLAGGLRVDGSAVVQPVSATALPLPTGASTSALQTTGNSSLSTIATNTTGLALAAQFPATLGAKTSAGSTSVVLASDEVVPISATALPLPAGAATSALQTTGNTSLAAITAQLPTTLGQKTSAASLAVVLASDETVPVNITLGSTPTLTNAAASGSSASVMAANTNRKGFVFFNDPGVTAGSIAYLTYGATASLTAYTAKVFPNSSWSDSVTCAVSVIWSGTLGKYYNTELV